MLMILRIGVAVVRTPSGSFLIQLGSYLFFIQAEYSRTSRPTSAKASIPVSYSSVRRLFEAGTRRS